MKKAFRIFLFISLIFQSTFFCENLQAQQQWEETTTLSKPWTRWWWMGSAVDSAGITAQLESFSRAGIGGVEITPIYGVKGYETQFLDYLSPQWLNMLDYTLKEAERLNMKVDMIMGTGWPYGGQQVTSEYAASDLRIQTYPLTANQTFKKEILINDPKERGLATLLKVISVKKVGKYADLTDKLKNNILEYKSKSDETLYAVFCGKTRQQVKRAAPGGQGNVLDHFSKQAFDVFAKPFDKVLPPFENRLHGIFNDSYEVFGADFTPDFFTEFKQRRGYDLLDYISILNSKPNTETYHRLLCDYRETISDLLLNNFANTWHEWCNDHTFGNRYQAHGSPGNLIDLYASADIPECEMFGSPKFDIPGYRRDTNNIRKGDFDKMMLKFSSSAAHLKGDEIVSSESFTWLREHFKTALSHTKPIADDFFVSGVNHMFLHGSTYSPADEKWPGWKFYAAVNFNNNNSIWEDAPALFSYIGRCQAILQKAKSVNDILLYWPVYDTYTDIEHENLIQLFAIHSMDEWLLPTPFYKTAEKLEQKGFEFDFLSDQFLSKCEVSGDEISVSNKVTYKAIVVPPAEFMPVKTLEKLVELQHNGANIIFLGKPGSVPGLYDLKKREAILNKIIKKNNDLFSNRKSLEEQLNDINIYGEKAFENNLKMIRKKLDGNTIYFIANHTSKTIDKYIPFNVKAKSILLMNPMDKAVGLAETKPDGNATLIRIQIEPGQSFFIKTSQNKIDAKQWHYLKEIGSTTLKNNWKLSFVVGGPTLPKDTTLSALVSWTDLGKSYEDFSGTADYTTTFTFNKTPDKYYQLDLGDVRESAKVYLNNQYIGTVFAQPFKINITDALKSGENKLKIEVTNLSANRIRELERDKTYEWKKFYEINMVNINYQPFDASVWAPTPSGLLSDIKIIENSED